MPTNIAAGARSRALPRNELVCIWAGDDISLAGSREGQDPTAGRRNNGAAAREGHMRRNTWARVVNPLLFLALLVQAVTGLGMVLFHWGAVAEVHEVGGIVLIVVAAMHITLHRR